MNLLSSSHFPEPQYPSFETMRRSVVLALNNHHAISEGPIAPVLPSMVDIGGILLEQKIKDTSPEISATNRSIILFSLGTRFTWQNLRKAWSIISPKLSLNFPTMTSTGLTMEQMGVLTVWIIPI